MKVTFLVNEQFLDLNIFQDELFYLEVEDAKSILKTSICHLLPFVKVGQYMHFLHKGPNAYVEKCPWLKLLVTNLQWYQIYYKFYPSSFQTIETL